MAKYECSVSDSGAERSAMTERTCVLWSHRSSKHIKDGRESSTSGGMILENCHITFPDLSVVFWLSVGIAYECLRTRGFDFDSDVMKKRPV